jgi:hypothetical protein
MVVHHHDVFVLSLLKVTLGSESDEREAENKSKHRPEA